MYNESDAREDSALFAEELQEVVKYARARARIAAVQLMKRPPPNKLVSNLNIPESCTNEGAQDGSNQEEKEQNPDNASDTTSDPDSDPEWKNARNRRTSRLALEMTESIRGGQGDIGEMMDRCSLLYARDPQRDEMEIKLDDELIADRASGVIFKESWHRADPEPGAFVRYAESSNMNPGSLRQSHFECFFFSFHRSFLPEVHCDRII